MAQTITVFHGADGDKIIHILSSGRIPKSSDGWTYLNAGSMADAFFHGADTRRKKSFVLQVVVTLPSEPGSVERTSTPGVRNTIKVKGDAPVRVEMMYTRVGTRGEFAVETIRGDAQIRAYLKI